MIKLSEETMNKNYLYRVHSENGFISEKHKLGVDMIEYLYKHKVDLRGGTVEYITKFGMLNIHNTWRDGFDFYYSKPSILPTEFKEYS